MWASLAAKAQSTAEIEAKLAARGVGAEDAAGTIAEALALGFLDDTELAGQLARGFRERGYGRRRAVQTLRRRGIPEPLASQAIDDVYCDGEESELARRALRSRSVHDAPTQRRAAAFLVRRGFSASAAWSAVRSSQPP